MPGRREGRAQRQGGGISRGHVSRGRVWDSDGCLGRSAELAGTSLEVRKWCRGLGRGL